MPCGTVRTGPRELAGSSSLKAVGVQWQAQVKCGMTHPSRSSESGAQLLARLEGKRCLKGLDFHLFPDDCSPAQGDVVEFHGMEGTGKTETLYHLVTCCILPGELGGLEVEVMYVDTDYHFDILRLVSILEHRLPQGSEEMLRACLCRVSVVHCSSSLQLLLTLHHVEGTLPAQPSLSLLVIDSISAFYWVDKYNGGDSVARQETNLRRIAELLEKIAKEHRIAVFATTHAVMRSNSAEEVAEVGGTSWKRRSVAPSDFTKVYLCRPWQRIVTHRVLFSKANMTKDRKQVFTAVSSSGRTNSTKRSSFCVTNAGIQFL